jgi:hypothetical protein
VELEVLRAESALARAALSARDASLRALSPTRLESVRLKSLSRVVELCGRLASVSPAPRTGSRSEEVSAPMERPEAIHCALVKAARLFASWGSNTRTYTSPLITLEAMLLKELGLAGVPAVELLV